MVFGPHNGNRFREGLMFARLLAGRPVLIPGDGTTLGHLSYVKDQARSCNRMMLNPRTFGEAYNLAGPDYYTDTGYVDTLAQIAGVTPEKLFMPPDLTEEAYQTMPYPPIQRHGARLVHWTSSSVFSTRKFEDHVGYRQEHTFLSGMIESFEWHQREGKDRYVDHDWAPEEAFVERARNAPVPAGVGSH
jgi:nucleoside-diphosphate-sugar epimerase